MITIQLFQCWQLNCGNKFRNFFIENEMYVQSVNKDKPLLTFWSFGDQIVSYRLCFSCYKAWYYLFCVVSNLYQYWIIHECVELRIRVGRVNDFWHTLTHVHEIKKIFTHESFKNVSRHARLRFYIFYSRPFTHAGSRCVNKKCSLSS